MRFLRLVRSASFVFLFLALLTSVAINASLFVGGTLFAAATSAVEAVTGRTSMFTRKSAELERVTRDLDAERLAKRGVQSRLASVGKTLEAERTANGALKRQVAQLSNTLALERTATKELREDVSRISHQLRISNAGKARLSREVARLSGAATLAVVAYRGSSATIKDAVGDTTSRISRRVTRSATREVGSMAAEAMPWFGAAVIVGVTALELKDLCDTLKDMKALSQAVDPDASLDEDVTTVCAMKVPSRDELWAVVKGSPQMAWDTAREYTPTLEELKSYEMPEIDWTRYVKEVSDEAKSAVDVVKDALDGAGQKTRESATDLLNWLAGGDGAAAPQATEAEIE